MPLIIAATAFKQVWALAKDAMNSAIKMLIESAVSILKISLKMIEKIIRKYAYEDSEYCLYYTSIYGMRNVIPKKWVEETILVPFEDVQIRIPKYYHEYLTHIYGDYMTPPPMEKRDDRHAFAFIDMDKRWSLKDIQKELSIE